MDALTQKKLAEAKQHIADADKRFFALLCKYSSCLS